MVAEFVLAPETILPPVVVQLYVKFAPLDDALPFNKALVLVHVKT
jgi:hypothetical protein